MDPLAVTIEREAADLERVQRIAADVLASVERPIVVRGLAYVRFACCDAPAHARAWAVEEARVAARMWEAMAEGGAIERQWLATPSRQFACSVCFRRARHDQHHHEACPVCRGTPLVAPPTCEGVVAMAGGAARVLAVEQHVRALVAALIPWGAREIETFVWRIRENARMNAPVPLRLAAAAAAVATRPPDGPPRSIAGPDDRRAAWRDAVLAEACVAPPPRPRARAWPSGVAFRALADPFVPLDAIHAAGAAVEELTDDDAVLAIPPVALEGEQFADLLELEDRNGRRPAARR